MGIIEIILYILLTLVLLIILGYGLCIFILPNRLHRFALWLAPWCAIIAIIFFGVYAGLIGFTVTQWAPLFVIFSILLSFKAFSSTGFKPISLSKVDMSIILIIIFITVLNLSPLFLQQKFPTTLSMGNTDAQAYALVPDYLKTHSLIESLKTTVSISVYDLIQFGYRWGPPVLTSFFLTVFNLMGFQFITIFQTIMFSISIPLVAILWKLLYKDSAYGIILSLFIVGLNVNILYFLYHNFFGQVIFMGINLLIIIFLVIYETINKPVKISGKNFNHLKKYWIKLIGFLFKNILMRKLDIVIAIALSALFFSYSEASIFIFFPIAIIVLTKLRNLKEFKDSLISYGRIMFFTFLLGSFSITHTFKFITSFRVQDFYKPIGWQVFRAKIPFANPFETLGLYSIHSFEPLYLPMALLLSIFIVYIVYIGLTKSKRKDIVSGFVIAYVVFFVVFAFIKPNFWVYNRAVSYAIPLIGILFIGGITDIFKSKTLLKLAVFLSLIGILILNSYKLNKKYYLTNLAVDKGLVSLKEVPLISPRSSIYTENVIQNIRPIWDELWIEYFLEPNLNIINSVEVQKLNKKISDGDLIITSKTPRYTPQTKVLLSKNIWENSYFKIGTLCSSDLCLKNSQVDLSKITIGESEAEDTLLTKGWESRETDHRWINSSEAKLKLITKKHTSQIIFTASSLSIPQQMTIIIDGEKIAIVDLSVDWKTYTIALPKPLLSDVHLITLKFSNTYRPSDLLQTPDTRSLFADFKKIYLE